MKYYKKSKIQLQAAREDMKPRKSYIQNLTFNANFSISIFLQNVHNCVSAGVGEKLSLKTLTTEELKRKLLKVLKNKRFVNKGGH